MVLVLVHEVLVDVAAGVMEVAPDLRTSKFGSNESAGSAGAAITADARRERTNVECMIASDNKRMTVTNDQRSKSEKE